MSSTKADDPALHSEIALPVIEQLAAAMNAHQLILFTVESCTGGGIGADITDLAGSSSWYSGGMVTYSNDMKLQLGVSEASLSTYGAVSEPVAAEMAQQGLEFSKADWCVSVTGVAGPDGGSKEKPVGMVCFGWASASGVATETRYFNGGRRQVRASARLFALQSLLNLLED